MTNFDAGSMPVSPSLHRRLAIVSLIAWFHRLEGAVISHEAPPPPPGFQSNALGSLRKAADNMPAVVRHTHKFQSFGSPRYPDEHPDLSWNDLAGHSRGKLGAVCEPSGPDGQCGKELVCRLGVCRHCGDTSECPALHLCMKSLGGENMCVPEEKKAWEKVGSDPWHMLCTILIFFSSVLAAAAGTGGGGMFVPLLVFFAALKAENAVPLSQCMIFCSSFCNLVLFVAQRHTTFTTQPKIDYDCIVLFEPMLCLGVTFGVLIHRMSPQWFLLVLLCVTLGMALHRTAKKGFKQRAEEAALMEQMGGKDAPVIPTSPRTEEWDQRGYFSAITNITTPKHAHLIGILFVWFAMFVASFHGLSACTWQFGVFFAALAGLLMFCTVVAVKYIITRPEPTSKPIDWAAASGALGRFTYPAVAFGGGALGGLLGLGGGVIMSPVLLEVGMHSESVQATTAVIVFLSSSIATIQFALVNQIVWHYALWYSCVTIIATCVGQHLCEVYVRRTGRYSIITLSIAGVLLFSLIALFCVGIQQVSEDIKYGQQMWWSTARLCAGGRLGILDVDVTPAQAWPSDIPGAGLPAAGSSR